MVVNRNAPMQDVMRSIDLVRYQLLGASGWRDSGAVGALGEG
jgi:hypothetical protein